MRQLRDDTHLILDGEVRVYRRERSKRWQAAFVIDGHTIRISTGKRDLAEAKEYAHDTFLEYKFRHKNDLPVVTKKFSDVAKLAIADMRKQLDAGDPQTIFFGREDPYCSGWSSYRTVKVNFVPTTSCTLLLSQIEILQYRCRACPLWA